MGTSVTDSKYAGINASGIDIALPWISAGGYSTANSRPSSAFAAMPFGC
jgi:hypothetical protein